jgi:Asp-tRNA(Asn)/Glu-tRNA(Gln) amidotransferase A subunit family amidase
MSMHSETYEQRVDAGYDPQEFRQLTYHDAVSKFIEGTDSPREYLERCLATIEERDPVVKAWVALRAEEARLEAGASAARYRANKALSPIDGMPIGIKDLFATKDLPTTFGIRDYRQDPHFDSASVRALRAAGAIILGKVRTAELGLTDLTTSTNPFDRRRTPGGSSTGSAAAVGARMVPAAIGSQVGGSLIRPASYNANFAFRPTMGGLHRGERQGYSHSVLGVHAGSLFDMWRVTIEVAKRAGGDPGYPGLFADAELPDPIKPRRLVMVETEGWSLTDEKTIEGFERILKQINNAGVAVVRRKNNILVEYLEQGLSEATVICRGIMGFENRWYYEHLAETLGDKLGAAFHSALKTGRAMSLDEYRLQLVRRDDMRQRWRAIAPLGDAVVTLSSPGPAPLLKAPRNPDKRVAYGTNGPSVFNVATSLLGVPAITMPLLAVDQMPVGLQIVGQEHQDEALAGVARWLTQHIQPVSV